LRVADGRYRYLDAEVEAWRPLLPAYSSLALFDEEDTWLEVTPDSGDVTRIPVDPSVVPLCRWLATRSDAFGPEDVGYLVDAAPLRHVVSLIMALVALGALRADEAFPHFLAAMMSPGPTTM
jgi:hypothetical protein